MQQYDVTGSPLVVSLPHFYRAHEDYLNAVTGLHPQQALHETSLHFEPVSTDWNLAESNLAAHEKDEGVGWFFLLGVRPNNPVSTWYSNTVSLWHSSLSDHALTSIVIRWKRKIPTDINNAGPSSGNYTHYLQEVSTQYIAQQWSQDI
jgi:hypothetical protein